MKTTGFQLWPIHSRRRERNTGAAGNGRCQLGRQDVAWPCVDGVSLAASGSMCCDFGVGKREVRKGSKEATALCPLISRRHHRPDLPVCQYLGDGREYCKQQAVVSEGISTTLRCFPSLMQDWNSGGWVTGGQVHTVCTYIGLSIGAMVGIGSMKPWDDWGGRSNA